MAVNMNTGRKLLAELQVQASLFNTHSASMKNVDRMSDRAVQYELSLAGYVWAAAQNSWVKSSKVIH